MVLQINKIRNDVKSNNPLIHCITNPISINQCANAILAVGARPIMAEHPCETEEITRSAKALLLNLGNITDVRIKSMSMSAEIANQYNIPFVVDMVGIGCSLLRKNFVLQLLKESSPIVIKGNYSEINALYNEHYRCTGVDAESNLSTQYICSVSAKLADKYNTVVLASGKTDIITDGKKAIYVKNGAPQLTSVTGSGCMLGALCACFLSVGSSVVAAAAACAVMGICGEFAQTQMGPGSFMVSLMDKLGTLGDADIQKYLNMGEFTVEKI